MTRGLVQTSRYSPGNMHPSALAKLFVGRDKTLRDVLRRIAVSATGEEKHFILLVGQRGVGKTHFVWLAHDRLNEDPRYSVARARLKIAFLNEEEWGVASFLDLIVRILRALESRYSDQRLSTQIEAVYKAYAKDPDEAMRAACDALVEFVGSDVLLLICENLDELFKGLGEEGQKRWRAFIQDHPIWTILATTPALFSAIQLQQGPFYGFFTIRELTRIDFDNAVELLRKKALLDEKPDLASFLETPVGRARARAIHHLAGGHHRVYIVMSDFLTRESLDDLFRPFMEMVDDLTPYYQDRIRQLAPLQRKIIEFLCRQERPVTVKTIAERCLISHQTAAKQLSELAAVGFVEKTPAGRQTYCELSEPLLRVCFEVKDNNTEHFRLFVDFLRRWFSARELRLRYEAVGEASAERSVDRAHLEAALKACTVDGHEYLLDSLDTELRDALREERYSDAVTIGTQLVSERGSASEYVALAMALSASNDHNAAVIRAREGLSRHPDDPLLSRILAIELYEEGSLSEALDVVDRGISFSENDVELRCLRGRVLVAMGRFEDVLTNEEDLLRKDPEHNHSYYTKVDALVELGRVEEAQAMAEQTVKEHPRWPISWVALALVHKTRDRHTEEVQAYQQAVTLDPADNWIRRSLANALLDADRYAEAYENAQLVLSRDSSDRVALELSAWAAWYLGRAAEAEAIAKRILEVKPDYFSAFHLLYHALMSQAKHDDALKALDRAISLKPSELSPRALKAELLFTLHKYGEALRILAGIDLSDEKLSMRNKINLNVLRAEVLIGLGNYEEATEAARKAIDLDPRDIICQLVACKSVVGAAGLRAALPSMSKVLSQKKPSEKDDEVARRVAQIMLLEAQLHGPGSLSRMSGQLRQVLDVWNRSKFPVDVITSFVVELLKAGGPCGLEWTAALPGFIEAFSDIPECGIPLNWLKVAQKYLESGSSADLLSLPVEQRTLLQEALR